jgi:hypothetical protein
MMFEHENFLAYKYKNKYPMIKHIYTQEIFLFSDFLSEDIFRMRDAPLNPKNVATSSYSRIKNTKKYLIFFLINIKSKNNKKQLNNHSS